jgi:hypothetical protein
MVESMDHTQDVERLFSWLKAPMVRYREFAPQIELAEAVATWPIVHRAAVRTGVAPETEPGPHGDVAVRERMARDRRFMPAAAARAIHDSPLPGTEALPATDGLGDRPAGDTAVAAPRHEAAEPTIAGFEEPAPPFRPESGHSEPSRPAGGERAGLFGGEYREREREREERPGSRAGDRHDRSLDAVFSRLAGARDRLPDPRERARTTPGLGPVFDRLR